MSDPVVEIPSTYTSDVSLSTIQTHLSTLYTYGAKCNSVREMGPSGMFSTGALLYGVLHNGPAAPLPLADISITVLEDMSAETGNFSYLANKYPTTDYKWMRKARPNDENDRADMYFFPIWHLTDNGTDLFENSRNGTASLADRFKEIGEYTNKYLIITEQSVISITDKMMNPDEPNPLNPDEPNQVPKEIRCIDPMASHATGLNIPIETIRENIWTTIQTFVAENPSWSVAKRDQLGSWVTILEKTQ
jgi:hypothetical protein